MYGTLTFLSDKALITFPKVNKDLLIFAVYFAISPWLLLSFSLYDPARSTKVSLPYLFTLLLSLVSVSLIM